MSMNAVRGLLLAAAVVFLMPWLSVSCGSVRVERTGLQLVTGSDVNAGGRSQQQSPEPFALVAGCCVLAGVALALSGRSKVVAGALGLVAGVALFAMKFRVDSALQQAYGGALRVEWLAGYWLALLFSLAAGAVAIGSAVIEGGATSAPPTSGGTSDRHPPAPLP